ncbi:MAG: transporter substrate-binding domain-containing protein [Termitinemataceae bacterium]|jgi:putative glutamine transport system substrate-binding protein|nr:MAG: transporter substrate-binding domain-containing protein [Termitinemataceae bacterium]
MAVRFKNFVFLLLCFLFLLASAGCAPKNKLDSIKKTGVLKVGVKSDVPGFGYFNEVTGGYEGLEIEIAKLIAHEILGDSGKIQFEAVTPKTRGPMLNEDIVDMIIATFTVTEERKFSYSFSAPYYTDSVGIMVKKDSNLTTLRDFNGKKIGVPMTATTRSVLNSLAKSMDIYIDFIEYPVYSEIISGLNNGKLDGFSVDLSILKAYRDWTTEIIEESFAPQPYAVATKLADKELSGIVNAAIQRWLSDGTIEGLIHRFNL